MRCIIFWHLSTNYFFFFANNGVGVIYTLFVYIISRENNNFLYYGFYKNRILAHLFTIWRKFFNARR